MSENVPPLLVQIMLDVRKRQAFTLIELLIVVVLIAILVGVTFGVLNFSGMRSKARDSQRIADLKTVQLALENYYASYRRYPATGDLDSLLSEYIKDVPSDPSAGSGHPDYCYAAAADGGGYILAAEMEVPNSAAQSPCSSLGGWGTLGGSCPLTNCYGTAGGESSTPGGPVPYAWVQIPPPPSGGITVTCSAFCASQGLSCKTGVCPAPCPSPSCSNNCSWNPPASQASHQIAEYHLYTESTGHSCGSCSWAFPIGTFPWGDLRPSWYTYYRGYCCCGGP